MNAPGPGRLERIFIAVLRARWLFVALYALLLPPSVYFAVRVEQDNSLDRLIVPSDPDFIATREFQKVFGAGEFALLLAEVDDPCAPDGARPRRRHRARARRRSRTSRPTPPSPSSGGRRPRFDATPEDAEAFRRFVTGTDLLRRQGLVGKDFLAIALSLEVGSPAERNATLAAIDAAIATADPQPSPLRKLTKLGLPFVNVYLDETQRDAIDSFVLFAVFVVVLNLFLYRSWRTLVRVPAHARRLSGALGRLHRRHRRNSSRSSRRWCR